MRRRFLTIAATWPLFAAAGAQAQADVTHCIAIEDPASRLACFDAATRGPQRTPTEAAAAPGTSAPSAAPTTSASASATAPAAAATAAATTAARPPDATPADGSANFGLTQRNDVPDKITASVRSVASHTVPGRWVVTLDNDQVWEQRETTSANRRPRPGDSVTIEQSSFGSYLMVTTGRGSSRVKRIR